MHLSACGFNNFFSTVIGSLGPKSIWPWCSIVLYLFSGILAWSLAGIKTEIDTYHVLRHGSHWLCYIMLRFEHSHGILLLLPRCVWCDLGDFSTTRGRSFLLILYQRYRKYVLHPNSSSLSKQWSSSLPERDLLQHRPLHCCSGQCLALEVVTAYNIENQYKKKHLAQVEILSTHLESSGIKIGSFLCHTLRIWVHPSAFTLEFTLFPYVTCQWSW